MSFENHFRKANRRKDPLFQRQFKSLADSWVKVRIALRQGKTGPVVIRMQTSTSLHEEGHPGFERLLDLDDIRDGTLCVKTACEEATKNGRKITHMAEIAAKEGVCLPREGDDVAVYIPLVSTKTSMLRAMFSEFLDFQDRMHEKLGVNYIAKPCLEEEFLLSVMLINPSAGIIFYSLPSLLEDPSAVRLLQWMIDFNGDCDICMDEMYGPTSYCCLECQKAFCKDCWRKLRARARSGNVPCPFRCGFLLRGRDDITGPPRAAE